MPTRRQIIKAGLIGGALLAVSRAVYGPFTAAPRWENDAGYAYSFLSVDDQTVVAALAPVILDGSLPEAPQAKTGAVRDVVRGFDAAAASLPPAVQEEIRDLFMLLGLAPSRRLLAGVGNDWHDATPEDIEGFLKRWQSSRLQQLQVAYQALVKLTMASWYAHPASWARIGYPGPITIA